MIKIYHFLGGISFAILLIATVATLVILGTFIESKTASHRYAAYLTYGNPFFSALLWGFFINIFVSALRRWPFQGKHLPFLITHVGLLLIFGGALVKSYSGIQGNMQILEGGVSSRILLPDTYAIKVTAPASHDQYPFSKDLHLHPSEKGSFPDLKLQLVGYAPHGEIAYESWIRGNKVYIQGLKPFEVHPEIDNTFPISSKVRLLEEIWNLMAFKTADAVALITKIQAQKQLLPALVFTQNPHEVQLHVLEASGARQTLSYLSTETSNPGRL